MSGGTMTPVTPVTVDSASYEEVPQLPLDTWRDVIGYHPFHFWQLADTSIIPVTSNCNSLVYERAWLDADQAGREEIRRAILTAESRLREHLTYSVGRRFIVETLQHPRPGYHSHQFTGSVGGEGRWLNIRLREGHVRSLGVETLTAISENAVVVYTDEDGDGLKDTATITITSTVTDPDEVGIYFGSADRLDGEPVSERWRIGPAKVSISSGTITIRLRRWLLVKPILYHGFTQSTKDPETAANFVTTVGVYRRSSNPDGTATTNAQAVLIWETSPYPRWATICSSSQTLAFSPNANDPAALAYGIARAGIRDAERGEITVGRAIYDEDDDEWSGVAWGNCRQPDRVIVRYEAGAPLNAVESTLNQSRYVGRWDEIVTRFAAAELSRRICACDMANRELYRWQFDMSRAAGANDEQYQLSQRDLDNPFGTRAGAIYAWRAVNNLFLTRAYLPG